MPAFRITDRASLCPKVGYEESFSDVGMDLPRDMLKNGVAFYAAFVKRYPMIRV